jgi:hypothetical protein
MSWCCDDRMNPPSLAHPLTEMTFPSLSLMQERAFIGPPLHDSFAELGLDTAGV